jgi:hypothetical protein
LQNVRAEILASGFEKRIDSNTDASQPLRHSRGIGMRLNFLAISTLAIAFPIVALADETITYTYDAKGRVTKVVRTGMVNNNVSYEYKHDKADNRIKVKVTNSPNPPPT